MQTLYKVVYPRHGPIIQFQGYADPDQWDVINTPLQAEVGILGEDIFESYDDATKSILRNIEVEVSKVTASIVAHEQSIIIDKRELAVLELRLAAFKKDGVPRGGHHPPKKNED